MSERDKAKNYLDRLEQDIDSLRAQLTESLVAQGVLEVKTATAELEKSKARMEVATAEMNLAAAEARAVQEAAGKMDELRTSMSVLQGSEALARASAEALGNELARERQARTEAEVARIAEAKRVDKAIEEISKATQVQAPTPPAAPTKQDSDKPIKLRSVVRERDGNGRSLVVDHEVIE